MVTRRRYSNSRDRGPLDFFAHKFYTDTVLRLRKKIARLSGSHYHALAAIALFQLN